MRSSNACKETAAAAAPSYKVITATHQQQGRPLPTPAGTDRAVLLIATASFSSDICSWTSGEALLCSAEQCPTYTNHSGEDRAVTFSSSLRPCSPSCSTRWHQVTMMIRPSGAHTLTSSLTNWGLPAGHLVGSTRWRTTSTRDTLTPWLDSYAVTVEPEVAFG